MHAVLHLYRLPNDFPFPYHERPVAKPAGVSATGVYNACMQREV